MTVEGFGRFTAKEVMIFREWFNKEINTEFDLTDYSGNETEFGFVVFDIESSIEIKKIRDKEIEMVGKQRHDDYYKWLES